MGWLRMISPMWIVATCEMASAFVLIKGGLSSSQRLGAMTVLLLCTAILIAVAVKFSGSDGVRDWSSGGVASITRDDSRRIAWSDWAILVTRSGWIDLRLRRLRLETKLFLGLIPWARVDRPIQAFDNVEAIHHYFESRDQDTGRTLETYDHAVELHRADGQPIRLFDLASGSSNDAATALVNRLAGRIQAALRSAKV